MLESFKELFTSTASTAMQRVRNPALGAFAMSWCAFNWKAILFLFLSDADVTEKITYISSISTWKTVIGYPCISVILICGFLPWVNNLISVWQAKPLDNYDSIENHRKAKQIQRATRLQRLQAKHDVTYDKVKTGAEKDIQAMREQITESQSRMGALTEEKNIALALLQEEKIKSTQLDEINAQLNIDLNMMKQEVSDLSDKIKEYQLKDINRVVVFGNKNNDTHVLGTLQGLTSSQNLVDSLTVRGADHLTPDQRNKFKI
ncbi:hypothetical protein [Atlantibacter hermannii]|uniref:hypothetical protein n=1 Tax=Atlantibacter hermannii TaxID=565 RepID=UPI0028AE7459|nr:hypothetical protein [Atlantibacter hermannii]